MRKFWGTIFSGRAVVAGWMALLVGLNLAAYAPSLRAPFIFDDRINILDNADVARTGRGYAPLGALLRPHLPFRRPLADWSFALNLRSFGPKPFSFHLVNLIIHILNAGVVFALTRRLIQLHSGKKDGDLIPALAGALLWSLHPVQTQAITYVVQRMTSLAALFYLLAFLFWILARSQPGSRARLGWALAALASAGIGFLVKETLITLPLAIVLSELVLRQQDRPGPRPWLAWAAVAGVLAAYGAGLLLLLPRLNLDVADNVTRFYAVWGEKILSQPRVIWHYLSLLAFPFLSRLDLDPAFSGSQSLFVPWTTLPAWLALCGALLVAAVKIKSRVPLFSALFFLLTLLPESVIPMDPVFEHRLYLPSTALLAAGAAALAWPGSRQKPRRVLAAVIVGLLGLLTFLRNQTWTDELGLWRDTVRKSPAKARPWSNLASVYESLGNPRLAAHAFEQAARLDPDYFYAQFNLARISLDSGDLFQARSHAERAHELKPEDPWAWLTLGNVESASGHEEAALEWFWKVWEKKPADPVLLERLGGGLLQIRRPDLAGEVYEKLFQLFPDRPGNYLVSGNLFFAQGRWSQAASAYDQELALDPDSTAALNNLGMARLKLGRPDQAREAFARAVALAPREGLFQANLCEADFDLGRLDRAEAACRRAVALAPSLDFAWKRLGEICLREGRREAALPALEQARKLAPEDPEVKALWEQAGGEPGGIRR